jgi:hypothetical protein
VTRPIAAVAGVFGQSGKPSPVDSGTLEHRLVELARQATTLRLEKAPAAGLLDARLKRRLTSELRGDTRNEGVRGSNPRVGSPDIS